MTTNEIARQIVDPIVKRLVISGQIHAGTGMHHADNLIEAITAALDHERQRAEKYKKALEFYANDDTWDREGVAYADKEYTVDYGNIARDALRDT